MDSDESDEEVKTSTTNFESPSKLEQNMTFCLEELCSDDEIYTFQGPESFNDLRLIENKLNSRHLNEAKNQSEVECYVFKTGKKNLTLAIPSKKQNGSLINLDCKGHIVIKKNNLTLASLSNEHEIIHEVDEVIQDSKHKISLEKKEKMRHPLLGVNWKSYLDIVDSAIMKVQLKKKIKPEHRERKKKKKKKIKKYSSEE